MSPIENISRRKFVKYLGFATGGLVMAYNLPGFILKANAAEVSSGEFKPSLFIQLNSDGSLILVASRSEMGQNIRTSLSSVIADEMDADWKKVSILQADGDPIYGDQNTDGSRSIRLFFAPLREMGATARVMLIQAAAMKWKVPESECTAENHYVIHKKTNQKISFGDLAGAASRLKPPKNVTLKSPKEYDFIGRSMASVDLKDFVHGKAKFGIDIRIPGMKFAAIARPPVTFGTLKSFDSSKALKVPGVEDIFEIPRVKIPYGALGGVAVIASNTWAALKGKEALSVTWEAGENGGYDSQKFMELMTQRVHEQAKTVKKEGDIEKAFSEADKIVESTFQLPHLSHAPMEVPNAVAWVKKDSCEIWAPLQSPQDARNDTAKYLGLDPEKVTVHVTFLGGAFGRKSNPDFVMEAVILSRKLNAPVQVFWDRTDDIQHDFYHTTSAQYLKAALDKNGRTTAWLHRLAFPSISSTFVPGTNYASGGELASGATNLPFEIPNLQVENARADAHVRIGWLRSVCNIFEGYATNVFADELAVAAKRDPLTYRLDLIGRDRMIDAGEGFRMDTARLKKVLTTAAKTAGWGKSLPANHGMGLAVHYSFLTYVAAVAEVSVIKNKLKVHKIHMAVDCGQPVNHDTIRAQLQGAAVFGMSVCFYGKITAKEGKIQQTNFDDYPVLRMDELPEVTVDIIENHERPTGIGEPGVPVIAPAIINAVYAATGKRYHNLPLTDSGLV
jgi:isoquinoline 1-oxidoreductase beta subunit